MGIYYNGFMIVGCYYNDIPEEIKEVEDFFYWCEDNDLDWASQWYDACTDGTIIGKKIDDVYEKDLDKWLINLKKTFKEVEEKLKTKPQLIGTQNIY